MEEGQDQSQTTEVRHGESVLRRIRY